jgi:hypothetical protein
MRPSESVVVLDDGDAAVIADVDRLVGSTAAVARHERDSEGE